MSFRDQMARDIGHTFFCLEEFGEYHDVNGKQMRIVLQENALDALEEEQSFFNAGVRGLEAQGLYRRMWSMHVPVADLGQKPAVGSRLILDESRRFTVRSVEDEMGVYALELEETRS